MREGIREGEERVDKGKGRRERMKIKSYCWPLVC